MPFYMSSPFTRRTRKCRAPGVWMRGCRLGLPDGSAFLCRLCFHRGTRSGGSGLRPIMPTVFFRMGGGSPSWEPGACFGVAPMPSRWGPGDHTLGLRRDSGAHSRSPAIHESDESLPFVRGSGSPAPAATRQIQPAHSRVRDSHRSLLSRRVPDGSPTPRIRPLGSRRSLGKRKMGDGNGGDGLILY